MSRWASAGIRGVNEDVADEDQDVEPPPKPSVGMARAARASSWISGPVGHPFAPVLIAVTTGTWVGALVFDAISLVSSTEWVYARGAWLLTGLGVASGLVASFAVLADVLAVPRGTLAFRTGVRQLLALDLSLVCATLSFLIRNASDFRFHDPSPTLAILLGVAALVGLGVAHWLGGVLTYRYGVRVALGDERRKGFEPLPD